MAALRRQPLTALACAGLAVAGCGDPEQRPPPLPVLVGKGDRFLPAPAPGPAATCRPGRVARAYTHVELFAVGRVVIVPAAIGVARPWTRRQGRIVRGRCRQPLFTLDPSGVVFIVRRQATLGDLFRIWGRPLTRRRMLSFRGHVRTYVEGRRVRTDPRAIRLVGLEQIALEVGPYVKPHKTYRYPRAFTRLLVSGPGVGRDRRERWADAE